MRVYNNPPPREGSFRRPPLAEFGVDGACSFANYTMGVRGTAVRSRGFRWRSGAAGRQRGMLTHSRDESSGHARSLPSSSN